MLTPATPSDLDEVMRLVSACVRSMRGQGLDLWDETYPDRAVLENDIRGGHLHLLRLPELAGCVCLNREGSPEYASVPWKHTEASVHYVHRLMVCPSHRGRGLARKIMLWAEAETSRQGGGCLRLDTFELNTAALALFDGLGYERAGHVRFRQGRFVCFERHIGAAP